MQNAPLLLSAKPTLPILTFLPTRSGDGIKIIERIGVKFPTLGTLLLADDDGAKTEAMIVSHHHQPADITRGILSSWLNGGGRKPVTWGAFIAVLHQADLQELAQDIEKLSSHGISLTHGYYYSYECMDILAFLHAGPTSHRNTSQDCNILPEELSCPKLQYSKQKATFDANQTQRELGTFGWHVSCQKRA